MNQIKQRQNEPINLKYLKAQRVMYARAKSSFGYQILLTIFLSVFFSFLKLIPNEKFGFNLTAYISVVSISISILDIIFFNTYISKLRTNGAKTQELFDCNIFELTWNEANCGSKPEKYVIDENEDKYVFDAKAPLEDWYDIDIDYLSKERAALLCQETNLFYDGQLREHFKNANIIICISTLILSVVIALTIELQLSAYITSVLLPILPIMVLTLKIIMENRKSLSASIELKKLVLHTKARSEDPSFIELRQIQDRIYCSRKDSSLVPEWYYKWRRNKLEKAMQVNARK